MGVASLEIVVMFFTILATIITFWRLRPVAAYLLIPYLFWVGYASLLTIILWQLNT